MHFWKKLRRGTVNMGHALTSHVEEVTVVASLVELGSIALEAFIESVCSKSFEVDI